MVADHTAAGSHALMSHMDLQSLINARQFLAGPTDVVVNNLTSKITLASRLVVHRHDQLRATRVVTEDRELLVLGHLLDPRNPQHSSEQVARATLAQSESFERFEHLSARLGGRWVAFLHIGGRDRLYPDATGSKSVFFLRRSDGAPWVASQPGLLADAVGAERDAQLERDFLGAPQHGNSWPCTVTPYRGVEQLLPNHWLDLRTGEVRRFWPTQPLETRSLDAAALVMRDLLHGSMAAVVARGASSLPLTAGYDSRTLFACAEELRESLSVFHISGLRMPWYDTSIPRRLTRRHGVALRVIPARPAPTDLATILRRNVVDMWWDPGSYIVSAFADVGAEFVLLGQASEITRCFYYPAGRHPETLDADAIAATAYYRHNRVAIDAFERWMAGVPKDTGLATLDLLYWEHRAGNWASMMATMFDALCEPIFPYNCRELLTAALSVDVAYRAKPYRLHQQICGIAAPGTLDIPFNFSWPDTIWGKASQFVPWRIREAVTRARERRAGFR
jgi:hypothetical protein